MYADTTCGLCSNGSWVSFRDLVDIPCKPPLMVIYGNKLREMEDYDIEIPAKSPRMYRIKTIFGLDLVLSENQRVFTLTNCVKLKHLRTDDELFVILGNKVMLSTVNEMERVFKIRPIRIIPKGKAHNAIIMKDENSRWKNMHAAGILSEDCNHDTNASRTRGQFSPFRNLDGIVNGQCFYLA